MSRYKKLKADYEKLEREYTAEIAKNIDLQNKFYNLQTEYRNNCYKHEEIEKLHDNTRRLKHDMKNHIMVIASYLNNNEVNKAKEYLSVVLDNLNRVYSYIQTGNSVLNYIINSKLEYAHRSGIQFKAEIENLSFANMGSVDFSAVLSNALDNAIEASMKASDKFIYVAILKKRGYNSIIVKNRIDKSVLKDNPNLNSTKSEDEAHGYGIKQIMTITNKYNGIVDIYEESDMFCISILIPTL